MHIVILDTCLQLIQDFPPGVFQFGTSCFSVYLTHIGQGESTSGLSFVKLNCSFALQDYNVTSLTWKIKFLTHEAEWRSEKTLSLQGVTNKFWLS